MFPSKRETAYRILQEKILTGKLQPGVRLMIDELSADLGMSSGPIQEALLQLQADSLVTIEPEVGAKVIKPNRASMTPSPEQDCQPPFFNILDYGAIGDGHTLNTAAIQAAINTCSRLGGGTVYVPAGLYVTGSIALKSHITLHLDAGATLAGSQDKSDYPITSGRWEGIDQKTHAPLIGGSNLSHIAIVGRGTIDGQGAYWWQMFRADPLQYPRPRLIGFTDCTNVLITGITLTNSPSWTVNPVRCDNVTLSGLTVLNPADSPNTDGLNPDSCRNVRISDCHIDVGDDCITIKSGKEDAGRDHLLPCENITITNCTMAHGHGGVVIGSEMSGGIKNVVISNCVFTGTDRGIRIKSRRGRGGVVEDIQATNIIMDKVLCPFVINLYYEPGPSASKKILDKTPYPVTEDTPQVRRIHLTNISARDVQYAAAFIYGLAEMPVEDISLNHISVSMASNAEAGPPDMSPEIELMQQAGFFAWNVRGLRLRHVEITNQKGPAFSLSHVTDVDLSASAAPTPPKDAPVICFNNVSRAFIHGCQAAQGTQTFLQLAGNLTEDIVLGSNNLAQAKQAVDAGGLVMNVPYAAVDEK